MPAAVIALAAPATARLIERAPCERAEDEQRRPVRVEPEVRRGRRPARAARSSVAIAGRSGTPTTRASRSSADCCGWCGKPTATCLVNRMPSRLATPGGTFTSWITIGVCRRHGGQVGRHRHVAAEADHDVGLDLVEHLAGRPASGVHIRSGVRARSMLTERGSW